MGDRPDQVGDVRASTAHVLEDHKRCSEAIASLEDLLAQTPDGQSEWISSVCGKLHDLQRILEEHFKTEDDTLLGQEFAALFPRFGDRVRGLRVEHAALLEEVETLALIGAASSPEDVGRMRRGARAFLAALRKHEAEENEIIMGAYWDDVGGCG